MCAARGQETAREKRGGWRKAATRKRSPQAFAARATRLRLPRLAFSPRLTRYGCVISSGLTYSSNCSPVRKPSAMADSRREMPFLCAFLATCAALS
jgi:hypothetical protein